MSGKKEFLQNNKKDDSLELSNGMSATPIKNY